VPVSSADTTPTLAEVFDTLAGGVVLIDAHDRIELVNASAERLLHTTRTQLDGRGLSNVLRNADTLKALCQRVKGDRVALALRNFQVHPVGNTMPTVHVDVVASPYGKDRVLLEIQDTEMKLQIDKENRLIEQRGIGRTMARQLAHEIKNPLGGLRGAAQLLAKKLDQPGLTDYTDVIIRESDRLVNLVNTMLGPTGPTQHRFTNIHRVLQHVKRLLVAESSSDVRIVEDYDPSLPLVSIDADRVIQALLNVARNALQAIDGNGTVTLRTRAISGFTIAEQRHALVLRIDISDTGPGIDDALRDQLFFPLVTSRPDGTGLGLAVAQELVSQHGGLIDITGSAPTTFSLYLPYLRRDAEHGESTS